MIESGDELMRALAGLRGTDPRVEWAQRVRERCHDRLGRSAREAAPEPRRIGVLEAATLAALWLYLARTLEQAARMVALRSPFN